MDELRAIREDFASRLGTTASVFGLIICTIVILELITRLVTLLRIFIWAAVTFSRVFVLWPASILILTLHALTKLLIGLTMLLALLFVQLVRVFCFSARAVIAPFKLFSYNNRLGQRDSHGCGLQIIKQTTNGQTVNSTSVHDINMTGRGYSGGHLHIFLSDRSGNKIGVVVGDLEAARAWRATILEGNDSPVQKV